MSPQGLILSTADQEISSLSTASQYVASRFADMQNNLQNEPQFASNSDVFEHILRQSSKTWVERLRQHPAEVAVKYLVLVIHGYALQYQHAIQTITLWGDEIGSPERVSLELGRLYITMLDAIRSTQDFARVHRLTDSPELLSVVAEMERLKIALSSVKDQTEKYMQRQVASLSLTESRKAIEMTDSVKLLTQLAFLFVPLTFSASIFGVNATELGSGSRPFSLFLITALAFLGATLSGLWLYRKLSNKLRRRLLRFAVLFMKWSPRVSIILAAWLLLDGQERTYDTLQHDTGYEELTRWIRRDFVTPTSPPRGSFNGYYLTTSKFWQQRLQVVGEFVNDPGWKSNLTTMRWQRNSRQALVILKNGIKTPGWLAVGWIMAIFVHFDNVRASIRRAIG